MEHEYIRKAAKDSNHFPDAYLKYQLPDESFSAEGYRILDADLTANRTDFLESTLARYNKDEVIIVPFEDQI